MNSEIIQLFRIVLERNKLAKARSSARQKLFRTRKACDYIIHYLSPMKMLHKENFDRLQLLSKQLQDYKQTCNDLEEFTRANRKFRNEMRKKYKTKQKLCANNCVKLLCIVVDFETYAFSAEEIDKVVTDDTVSSILLGLPAI